MNTNRGNLQARLLDLKKRASETSSDEERLRILAEATVLQQLIKHFAEKQ